MVLHWVYTDYLFICGSLAQDMNWSIFFCCGFEAQKYELVNMMFFKLPKNIQKVNIETSHVGDSVGKNPMKLASCNHGDFTLRA